MVTLVRILGALATSIVIVQSRGAPFQHVALDVQRRQEINPTSTSLPSESSTSILTYITPSPSAAPVAVTKQSQIVTIYKPQFTLCELPLPTSDSLTPLLSYTTATYRNYSISTTPSSETCTTIYSETETMVCATTLTALASQVPITNCAQDVTFSSEFGYSFVLPTPTPMSANKSAIFMPMSTGTHYYHPGPLIIPAPSILSLTTYYLAPWTELTAGTAPADVQRKVCTTLKNGTEECIAEYEIWRTSLVSRNATTTTTLNFTTTIHGPSQMIVLGTFVANITETLTKYSFSTSIETSYQTQYTTTERLSASVSTAPTVYETFTVDQVTPSPTSSR